MATVMEPEQHQKWSTAWSNNDRFFSGRLEKFHQLDSYLKPPPANMLEIGCGLAVEAELFQKKYDCDLFLLDGDGANNDSQQVRDIDYGDAETMQFYLTRAYLEQQWQRRSMRYQFIDAANPLIPDSISFDFIYSSKSCGFHYPLATYRDLIRRHSHPGTVVIVDLRKPLLELEEGWFQILEPVMEWDKGLTAHVRVA